MRWDRMGYWDGNCTGVSIELDCTRWSFLLFFLPPPPPLARRLGLIMLIDTVITDRQTDGYM